MAGRPDKPLDRMTEDEIRAWKDWLTGEGSTPWPWALADPIGESVYDYEEAGSRVIERSAEGNRYVIGLVNGSST